MTLTKPTPGTVLRQGVLPHRAIYPQCTIQPTEQTPQDVKKFWRKDLAFGGDAFLGSAMPVSRFVIPRYGRLRYHNECVVGVALVAPAGAVARGLIDTSILTQNVPWRGHTPSDSPHGALARIVQCVSVRPVTHPESQR